MKKKSKFFKYFREYKWSNIFAMIKNNSKNAKICTDDFRNKLVVITGTTSGIGYHTARKYASRGADIITINRNKKKAETVRQEIEKEFHVKCTSLIADLSILKDIFRVSNELLKLKTPIDILIHNAGIYLTKKTMTPDGLESVFVVNYLSSFIINYLLMEKLKKEGKAKIIMVGSEGHRFAAWGINIDDLNYERHRYSDLGSYGQAKMAELLSMIIFNEKFKDSGVTINVMHPGAVKSETGQENGAIYKWFKKNFLERSLKSPKISTEALYYLGVSKDMEVVSGKFFNLTTEEEPAPPALDREVALELWDKSLKLSRLKDNNT